MAKLIEIECKTAKGEKYRRLLSSFDVKEVVENPKTGEVYIFVIGEKRHRFFKNRREYIICAESFDELKAKLAN